MEIGDFPMQILWISWILQFHRFNWNQQIYLKFVDLLWFQTCKSTKFEDFKEIKNTSDLGLESSMCDGPFVHFDAPIFSVFQY